MPSMQVEQIFDGISVFQAPNLRAQPGHCALKGSRRDSMLFQVVIEPYLTSQESAIVVSNFKLMQHLMC